MLTTDDFTTLGDYVFKNSPESCSTGSYYTDSTDEDFLQQLSSDLDIPLLLNPGEDEMSLLNSFFDQTPDEIMSEIALPITDHKAQDQFGDLQQLDLMQWGPGAFPDLQSDIKSEPSSCSSSNKSPSPIHEPQHLIDVKEELKVEPLSPPASINTHRIRNYNDNNGNKLGKITPKRVPIQPKTPYGMLQTKNKVVLLKNSDLKLNPVNNNNRIIKTSSSNVVVLESIPITSVSSIPQIGNLNGSAATSCRTILQPMVIKDSLNVNHNNNNIDPRILKRQQRKIKNRESACLSRKKKKDYLTSLENQVNDLTIENQNLKLENSQLKTRLCRYERIGCAPINNTGKNVKNSVIVCMFLLAVGLNFNYVRRPFIGRNQVEVVQSTKPQVSDHYGRTLLWTGDNDSLEKNDTFNFSPFTMCPAAINQTESARLVLELERWIGKPKGPQEVKDPAPSKTVRTRPLRKRKTRKYETRLVQSVYSMTNKIPATQPDNDKEIQVFSPNVEQLYSEFFEAINRQDDTFYVVSFSDHHMLLPALHHNKTRRPKMSLIMPSVLPNGMNSSHPTFVPLMQIDCEVLDTRLIQVHPGSIPKHLRSEGNSTSYHTESKGEVKKTDTQNYTKKAYKPYFVKQGKSPDFYG